MTFNDLELTGNPAVGSQVIIPSGQLPAEEQPGYVAPRGAARSTTPTVSPSFAGINYGNYGAGSSWRAGCERHFAPAAACE